jgi:hypothetical protein
VIGPARQPRAVYCTGTRHTGQVRRLHIIREQGPKGADPGSHALCGAGVWSLSNSEPVIVDPMPAGPPEGLSWCPKCVGCQAELSGLIGEFAARLAGA